MTTFLLIRHGENDYLKRGILVGTASGIHLNRTGRQQSLHVRKALSGISIKGIYSSPLERALETADPLAKAIGLTIATCNELADTNVGEWAFKQLKELSTDPSWRILQEQPENFRFPGGEFIPDCQSRMVNIFKKISRLHDEDDILSVFSHADPIKLLLCHIMEMPLKNFQNLTIDPGTISILRSQAQKTQVIAVNHLPTSRISQLLHPR